MLEDLQYVTVVPSLIDDNGDVLPTAARIRVRVDGWDRYQDDTVQRYDANGQVWLFPDAPKSSPKLKASSWSVGFEA